MAYKATGRLHKIFDSEQKSASFAVRDFVIEVADDKFPQMVKFQLTQDKCALIDNFSEGDEITVDFDLRGREWNEKYFTNLNAWRIAGADAAVDGRADAKEGNYNETPASVSAPSAIIDDLDDDIPF